MRTNRLALTHVNVMSPQAGMWHKAGDAVLADNGTIVAVGSSDTIADLAMHQNTSVVDYADHPGATCYPAFMDAHLHLDLYGFSLLRINLNGVTSLEDALACIGDAGKPDDGGFIGGDCWDDELWKSAPHRRYLDAMYHDSPVALSRKDYHSLWMNTAALKATGLWASDQFGPDLLPCDMEGPTGIVHDAAMTWALARLPQPALSERLNALKGAMSHLLSLGFASCCSMDYGIFAEVQQLATAMEGEPRLRIWQAVGVDNLDAVVNLGLRSGFGSDFLRVGGIKLFADGSLGSRTAYMQRPWPGQQGGHGLRAYPSVEWLTERFNMASEHGWWIWIHAIGDLANHEVLNAFAAADTSLSRGNLHHRIEHAQFLQDEDIPRFADLGVAASVQPSHLDLDIGKLATTFATPHPGSYAFRSLLDAGAKVAFGSDAPVEDPDALKGIAFAAFRTRPGEQPFQPEQCVTVEQALTAYTATPQELVGMAGRRGAIVPGQDADLVVLAHDVLTAHTPEEIRGAHVLTTVVDGRVVFSATR
jgi:predicted amidohydrolase YtcJ